MATHSPSEKQKLRRVALQVRAGLPMADIGRAICRHIERSEVFTGAVDVLSYAAVRQEVDLAPLMSRHPSKAWYLPKVVSGEDRTIRFHQYISGALLSAGAYGIPEPDGTAPVWQGLERSTLVLVPGVMYDIQGYRLGYGKGFYDAFLSTLPPGCVTVGVVPRALLCEALPTEAWDLSVHWLVTEEHLTPVPGRP